jgi:hypothetical protein
MFFQLDGVFERWKALSLQIIMRKQHRNDRVQGRFPQFCGLLLS